MQKEIKSYILSPKLSGIFGISFSEPIFTIA